MMSSRSVGGVRTVKSSQVKSTKVSDGWSYRYWRHDTRDWQDALCKSSIRLVAAKGAFIAMKAYPC